MVVAPDQIYEEIEALALYLDDTATESTEITVVVPVTRANPEAIQTALNSVFGQQAVASVAQPGASGGGGNQRGGGNSGDLNPEAVKAIQQRIQAFRDAAGGRGNRGGGNRGGGDRGGGDRGGGNRGR